MLPFPVSSDQQQWRKCILGSRDWSVALEGFYISSGIGLESNGQPWSQFCLVGSKQLALLILPALKGEGDAVHWVPFVPWSPPKQKQETRA